MRRNLLTALLVLKTFTVVLPDGQRVGPVPTKSSSDAYGGELPRFVVFDVAATVTSGTLRVTPAGKFEPRPSGSLPAKDVPFQLNLPA
jgi:hypothetical protein